MFARGAVIGHPTKDVHPEPAEGLFSYSPFLAGQCKIISVHVGHLPVPKSLAAKSSVSTTSKLIETKELQVVLLPSSIILRVPHPLKVVREPDHQGLPNFRAQGRPRR